MLFLNLNNFNIKIFKMTFTGVRSKPGLLPEGRIREVREQIPVYLQIPALNNLPRPAIGKRTGVLAHG